MCGFVGLFSASCVKDKGNYDYVSPESIMGIEIEELGGEEDQIVRFGDSLKRTPIVLGDTTGCAIRWFVIPTARNLMTLKEERTLSNRLELGIRVPEIPATEYYLYLEISKGDLIVTSEGQRFSIAKEDGEYGLQWFILKDEGGYAEFDYFDPDAPEGTPRLKSDVLLKAGLERPQGTPISFGYSPSFVLDGPDPNNPDKMMLTYWSKPRLSEESGSPNSHFQVGGVDGCEGVLTLITDRNIRSYDIMNMEQIATETELFYEPPILGRNGYQNLTTTSWTSSYGPTGGNAMFSHFVWIVVDGKMYTMNMSTTTVLASVKMSDPSIMATGLNEPYELHREFMRSTAALAITLVFDRSSHSFMYLTGNDALSKIYRFPDNLSSDWIVGPPSGMESYDMNGMDYDLVTTANDQWSPAEPATEINVRVANNPLALMKSIKNSDDYLLLLPSPEAPIQEQAGSLYERMPTYPFARAHEVPPGDYNIKKEGAKLHLHGAIQTRVWVAYKNAFYQYNFEAVDDANREVEALVLPENEEIAYFYQYLKADGESLCKVVLSNNLSLGKWYLRVYDIGSVIGGRTYNMKQPTLIEETSGDGKAVRAMYLSNKVGTSYFN